MEQSETLIDNMIQCIQYDNTVLQTRDYTWTTQITTQNNWPIYSTPTSAQQIVLPHECGSSSLVATVHHNLQMQTAFPNTIRIPQVRTRSSEIRSQFSESETVFQNWNCIRNKQTVNSIKLTIF